MNYKKCILYIPALIFWLTANAQVFTDHIERTYKAVKTSSVEVSNKYGKVHVMTWDKDSVKFEIDFSIKSNSAAKVNRIKNNIELEFTGTQYYITAKTKILSSTSMISDFMNSILPVDMNQATIDYTVYIPGYASIKVDNKFGDVYIDDIHGSLELNLSNGDLKANRLNGSSIINVGSGNGTVNYMNKGKLIISYSDFHVKESNRLNVESRSSKLYIDDVDYLKIISRRDKVYITDISKLTGDSYFSDFSIQKLVDEMNYNLKYGDITINSISRKFSFINLNSEYTDINLLFDAGSYYYADITHHEDAYLIYPGSISKLEDKVIDKEQKLILSYGKVGKTVSEKIPKLKINAVKKCTINITHK